jgi:hypothetical protein
MAKYSNFSQLFDNKQNDEQVQYSIQEIQEKLGFSLPDSAKRYHAWWANETSHVQAIGWLTCGWKVHSVDMKNQTVLFHRIKREEDKKQSGRIVPGNLESSYQTFTMDFSVISPKKLDKIPNKKTTNINTTDFKEIALHVMSAHYNVALSAREIPSIPKLFDLVSNDNKYVGIVRYLSLVLGESILPPTLSSISENIWILEQIPNANKKFVVFGNDRIVPDKWLEKYGMFVKDIEFFFYDVAKEELFQYQLKTHRWVNLMKGE